MPSLPLAVSLSAELLKEAQGYTQVTPLQVSLLYELCSVDDMSPSGAIALKSFYKLLPTQTTWPPTVAAAAMAPSPATSSTGSVVCEGEVMGEGKGREERTKRDY